jgi:hypothetical protein
MAYHFCERTWTYENEINMNMNTVELEQKNLKNIDAG